MRVSIYKHDSGYVADPSSYSVFLNGRPLTSCVTADEERGLAICYALDKNKQLIIDGKGVLKTVTMYGIVEIRRALN